ncbi:unnamed protein product [Thelazia callipaeda]|uniref:Macrophage migration inhibitory factor n=1 Tax=Thelazia callipaeda TaxID=103827 RepID=A0A158RBR5_THECL|nr:unnamed protein product [Thelazia callipaeda]
MPLITVISNVAANIFPSNFNMRFAQLMADMLGKPANRVVLLVTPGAQLTHGITQDPSCLIVAKAIDSFSAEKNKVYSSLISEFMKKELDIDPSHCIIHFQNLDAGNVGCCSTTMQELLKK